MRSRCSWPVAGNATRATPAVNDGTTVSHGSVRARRSSADGRVPSSASIVSSRNRDGIRSVVRRRSPRGNVSTRARRGSECGEESAVVVVHAGRPQGERAVRGPTVGVGEQRVVAHAPGEGALDQAAHDDDVEVEAEPARHGTDAHAVAEAADAPEVGVELERERPAEHVDARRGLDRVEPGQPFERGLDLVGSRPLGLRPRLPTALRSQVAVDEALRPVGQLAPGSTGRGTGVERVGEAGDEREQVAGLGELPLEPLGARVVVGAGAFPRHVVLARRHLAPERMLPLAVPAHDAGAATDLLPARRVRGTPVGLMDRCRREERHDVVTVEVAVGQRQQREQGAAQHALRQRAHCVAVVHDAGGVEVLVHEPCVRVGGAVEHGHVLERDTVAQRVDHGAHDGAHLVVGIRRGGDVGAVRGRHRPRAVVPARAERLDRCTHRAVGAGHAGGADQHGDRCDRGDRVQQPYRGRRQLLRQVQRRSHRGRRAPSPRPGKRRRSRCP